MHSLNQKIALIKLGGSIITKPNRQINVTDIGKIAFELLHHGSIHFVIVHGGGTYTKSIVRKHGLSSDFISPENVKVVVELRNAMQSLNEHVVKVFRNHELNCVSVKPREIFAADSGKIAFSNINIVDSFQKKKVVPILYGDVLDDVSEGYYACSSDNMVAHLAQSLKAYYTFFLTDVDGVYLKFPPAKQDSPEKIVKESSLNSLMFQYKVGYGDMYTKVEQALCCAKVSPECWIINGHHPVRLSNILFGRSATIGTKVSKGE